jgi:hypothetical protein
MIDNSGGPQEWIKIVGLRNFRSTFERDKELTGGNP